MEEFNAFVGGLSGVFKGLRVSQEKGHYIKNLQKLKEITQRNEVTALNWADNLETEVLVGYSNQLVKIYDLSKQAFIVTEEKKLGEGPVCGIFKLNGSLVTAVESGVVKVWSETGSIIDTGGPLNRMKQNPNDLNIIGTGGKENDLKLWDLETKKTVFQAKNVRHDELELRVPIWVMDLTFRPEYKQVAVATRYGHVRLYDPSTPTRRPVCQVTAKDHSFTCIAPAPMEHQVVVGCTTGNMYLVDLRGKGLLLNKFKGFMGGVRQVACPTSEPYVVSVSLDRHFRVHNLNTKRLIIKEYMQSRLSALLLKSSFTMQDIKEEAEEIKEEGEEANVDGIDKLFHDLEVVIDQSAASKKRSKSISTKNTATTLHSEEEVDEIFDSMEVVTDTQKCDAAKRPNSKVKTRSKKLKTHEHGVITVH